MFDRASYCVSGRGFSLSRPQNTRQEDFRSAFRNERYDGSTHPVRLTVLRIDPSTTKCWNFVIPSQAKRCQG